MEGERAMVCTLMHKRLAVAELELDDATGFIQRVNTVYVPEHLPVGTLTVSARTLSPPTRSWSARGGSCGP